MTLPPAYAQVLAESRRRRYRLLGQGAVVLGVVVASSYYTGLLDAGRLAAGAPDLVSLAAEMLPPDFTEARTWVRPLLDTLAMSVAGTALAVLFSLGLACLAARTTTPGPVVYRIARGTLNALRAVPELILGIIFVAAVGFGALPGVLALGFHSVGMVGKFFAEAIEHAREHPIEAVRATGASPVQVGLHGVLPQVIPQMADVVIYRWEYNFRASTVLGAVGAGGIGFELIASLRVLQYREVLAIILVILAMVTVVDGLGAALRRRFT